MYSHYPKNTYFLNSPANKKFEEVLAMSDDEFTQWVKDVRSTIVDIWDNKGIPPVNGYAEDEIVGQFNALYVHDISKMYCKDELTGDLCIRNTHNKLGNACNSWFPTMMKTRINYGTGTPRSIYDFMKEDDLLAKYMPYARRHFKRDSFYAYSQCVPIESGLPNFPGIKISNAVEWIKEFEKLERPKNEHDYWISEKDEDDEEYTGYNEKLVTQKFHTLTYDELKTLQNIIPILSMSNVKKWDPKSRYQIRLYEKNIRIFPVGLKSFRISMCQVAVNYPPTMAKLIWERYTEEFKTKNKEPIYIWDPSCGWGGRILGAMAVKPDRKIVYLGTDPNPDHTISSKLIKTADGAVLDDSAMWTKYDDLAQFFNDKTTRGSCLEPSVNDWKVWQSGSEVIQHNPEFQKYKGKLSVVFTSPPYFHREEYSVDKNQSCHKFSAYDDWKNGFLYETLKTAYEWLRPGGYICWNIASIKEGKTFIPLEEDSKEIMEKLGFEYVQVIKMALGSMPGGNRVMKDEETGELVSTNKNTVRMNGQFFRYEPIWVYRKPL